MVLVSDAIIEVEGIDSTTVLHILVTHEINKFLTSANYE